MEELQKQLMNILDKHLVTEIKSRRFKDKRNGEIVTKFSIMDIKYMEEIKD